MSSQLPVKATSFADLAISTVIHEALSARGIETPSPIQAEVVPLLLQGRDVIAQARTGSGKTLAFALPIIERLADANASGSPGSGSASGAGPAAVQALVLVPTRELAIQVGEVVGPLAALRRLRTTLLYGGRALQPESRALRSAQIVVGTPGRTLDHLRQGQLNLRGLRVLVLDEADEMLDRGFARDVERIIGFTPATRQSALFSATVPAWVAGAARTYLREPATVAIDAGETSPPDIEQMIYTVPSTDKLPALMTLLDRRDDGPVIVFGRTKHGVKKLAQKLAGFGYPAAALQGNLSQNARERVMVDFRSGRMPILLATNVAARGLDVAEVDLVINYELPETAEWFTHRVGRTGRMGRRGQAVTLLTPEDGATWRQFERQLGRSFPRRAWGADDAASTRPADGTPAPSAPSTGTAGIAGAGATAPGAADADGRASWQQPDSAARASAGVARERGRGRTASGGRDAMSGGRDARLGRGDAGLGRGDAGRGRGVGASGFGERSGGGPRSGSSRDGTGFRDGSGSGDGSGSSRDGSEPRRDGGAARRDRSNPVRQGRDGRRDAIEPGREARDGRRDGFRARRDGLDPRGDAADGRRDGERGASGARHDRDDVRRDGSAGRDVRRDGFDDRRDGSEGRRDGFDGPRGGTDRRQARPAAGAGPGSNSGSGRSRSTAGNVAMKVAGRRPNRRGRKPLGRRGAGSAAA